MSTYLDADTLLAIDVGTVNTRASLFDVVDGRYRLIATGWSLSPDRDRPGAFHGWLSAVRRERRGADGD
ncbi:MAG: hypothetical protein P8X64_13670 [Anaerolineales bacterium]